MSVDSNAKDGLVVILADGSLSPWRLSFLGVPTFQRMGLQVVHFNYRRLVKNSHVPNADDFGIDVDLIRLRELIAAKRPTYVLSSFDLENQTLKPIRQLLEEYEVPWCFVLAGFIPAPRPARSLAEMLTTLRIRYRRLRQSDCSKYLWELLLRLARSAMGRLGIKRSGYPPKYIVVEGTEADVHSQSTPAIIIPGHSRDYERVLMAGLLETSSAPEDICVFLDSNECGHMDFEIMGFSERDVIDEKQYLEGLQRSFKTIEKTTGLRVVVLPHPRYTYPSGHFGPYEISADDTMKMVSAAKLVVGHYSTALAFAVIFNKPVVLLNSAPMMELAGGYTGRYIDAFQRALGCPMLFMENPDPELLRNWQNMDEACYTAYRDRYIKYPGSPDISMWDNAVRKIAQHEGWQV